MLPQPPSTTINMLDKAQNISIKQCQGCNLYSKLAQIGSKESSTTAMHKKMTLHSNEYLFRQGQMAMGIFCVEAGTLVTLNESSGKNQILTIIKPQQILGTNAVNTTSYQHTAKALTDTQVCFIPKPTVVQLMNQNIQFKLLLMKALCQEIDSSERKSLSIIYKSARQRVAALILEVWRASLAANAQQNRAKVVRFAPETLAGVANISKSNLLKILHEFDQNKWIKHDKNQLKVMDETLLENLL